MENEFSLIELQLMQSMVRKCTDQEIAEIINHPVEMVKAYTLLFSSKNNIVSKQSLIDEHRIKKERKAAQLKLVKCDEVALTARNKMMARYRMQRQNDNARKEKRVEKIFETKRIDLSKMISVRIDHKTTIFVKRSENTEDCKRKYLKSLKDSIPVHLKTNMEVKKFKPLK